jgi:DNA-binding CsgD family transcriptional regulator
MTKPLSPGETDVITLIANGYDNPEIARKLHISQHTVKSRLVTALRKLGARNRSHAVAIHTRTTAPSPADGACPRCERVRAHLDEIQPLWLRLNEQFAAGTPQESP